MEQRAVSEVVGYVLAFGIVTTMAIFVFYNIYPQAITVFQESKIKILETQMSILDYSASLSALGDSPTQLVKFNLNGASVWVDEDGNRIEIYPVYNGSIYSVPIYNGSIGRVIAKYGDTIIAYEGGGVWEKRGSGVIMITPPEFHFKIDTLTLPLIKITGNFSAGGEGSIPLSIVKRSTIVVYPNETIDSNFTNPLTCDYLILKLQSEFYDGWKKYFEERSDAEITAVYPENNTIIVKMATRTPPIFRTYDFPITIRQLNYTNDTPLQIFEINFVGLNPNFDLIWRTYTDPELFILFKKAKSPGNNSFRIGVVYYDYNASGDRYESWVSESFEWDVSTDTYLLDLLTESKNMTYEKPSIFVSPTGVSFSNQPEQPSWTWGSSFDVSDGEDFTIQRGVTKKTVKDVIEHYFRVLASQTSPEIKIYEDPKTPGSAGFNTALTTYRLYYGQVPPVITFLHIAEHKIEISG